MEITSASDSVHVPPRHVDHLGMWITSKLRLHDSQPLSRLRLPLRHLSSQILTSKSMSGETSYGKATTSPKKVMSTSSPASTFSITIHDYGSHDHEGVVSPILNCLSSGGDSLKASAVWG
ncbi:hypothetical protein ACFE04_010801 [Oxalis oulophora]